MSECYQSLSHSKWDCKYHVIGFLKGKSAIAIARQFKGKRRNFSGESFWARGYAVSAVGFELGTVKRYIQDQDVVDRADSSKSAVRDSRQGTRPWGGHLIKLPVLPDSGSAR